MTTEIASGVRAGGGGSGVRAGGGGSGVVALGGSAALAATILSLSPVGYWKLNETSGTNADDSTANNRDGTYTSTYTLANQAGPDGANYVTLGGGYITIPDNNAWSVNTSGTGLTVFCLARPTALTLGMFVSKGAASNYEWQLSVGTPSSGDLVGQNFTLTATNQSTRQINGQVANNTWQAIAFATPHDPTNSTPPDINVNNSYLTGSTSGQGFSGVGNGTAALVIGHRADTAAGHDFTGALAHVAIFPTKLSTTNMGILMTAANAWLAGS